jgi:transcriptional adapter 2-alpha
LSCFSQGSETPKHKSDHSYSIRRDDFTLFPNSNWTAREEKEFLNLMHKFGVGNWDEISAFMTKKSPFECRAHFYKFYFDGVFNSNLGLTNENAYVRHNVSYLFKANSVDPPRGDLNSFLSKSMAGYRFARSEFDIPYDNSAESILNNITLDVYDIFSKDPQTQKLISELNCALLRAYNHRLQERKRRYRIISQHGLIVQRKTLAWLSKYSEVFQHHSSMTKFSAFMQISDPMSFDFLLESMKHFHDTKRYLYR